MSSGESVEGGGGGEIVDLYESKREGFDDTGDVPNPHLHRRRRHHHQDHRYRHTSIVCVAFIASSSSSISNTFNDDVFR